MAIAFKDKIEVVIDKLAVLVAEKVPPKKVAAVTDFIRQYYRHTSPRDIANWAPLDLYGAALSHWNLGQRRLADGLKLKVFNPHLEEYGWQSTHTVIEIVAADMPFLVDSVRMELNRHGLRVHRIIHPIILLRRAANGRLLDPPKAPKGAKAAQKEAYIHVEVDRQTDTEVLQSLQRDLRRVLEDVRKAVEDWPHMRQMLSEVVQEIKAIPPGLTEDDVSEVISFLEWLNQDNFTLLGFCAYRLEVKDGQDILRAKPESGLGILREIGDGGPVESQSFAALPASIRRHARQPELLILTKASARATVHRPVNLDYIGIKRFDDQGAVLGEHRFLGLYTSAAYNSKPREIPILRRKADAVLEKSGLDPDGHSGKALLNILETYPRDELFQITIPELLETSQGILRLDEQQRIRLFVRRDPFGRFVVCLVFAPRERYNTEVRKVMQEILRRAFNGSSAEFMVSLSESLLARIEFIVRTQPEQIPEYDVEEIESLLVEATLSWEDRFHTALIEHKGEEAGNSLFQTFAEAFPAGYREDFPARAAVYDVEHINKLGPDNLLEMSLYHPLEAPSGWLRFRVFRSGEPIPLYQALPILRNMGMRVVDARPYRIDRKDGPPVWVHDFGMTSGKTGQVSANELRGIFQDAFARLWRGETENDGFNRLVLYARLTWREITVLRGYCKYLRQTVHPFSQAYIEQALTANPKIARMLVDLFHSRFDPANRAAAATRASRLAAQIQEALDAVQSLDEDRILRSFFNVIQATLRTNYFQTQADGSLKPYLSFKLDPREIPDLPEPRPMFEIFVYSPRVEGAHLRGGKVARGGLRWSDRREDFRTEILGLMKAQMVKNALIVPVGAKGGFVVKRLPLESDKDTQRATVIACYEEFIRGLLDVTDNLVEGKTRPPDEVLRFDGDDPYLVVAADKGTATFSDLANAVAGKYEFWLGDAFASGGKAGYDHKKMGITARSGWESVRHHFHALGLDIQTEDFSVLGIGDMSGDVLGNGMLLSPHIKLIAAFDHRHIFLDPDPDPAASYRERSRLFGLPSSSWQDYDTSVISPGGGVYSRSAKSVRLSKQIRKRLGIKTESMQPNDLIRSLLKAPLDLLWNGGIGTYVKASSEQNAEIGDRLNDGVRVNGRDLRCRVVGEGGNLGFSQRGRIEYARNGGRIDTDFVHNAGGVNCSDHEVNIKILLNQSVTDGDLTEKQRNLLLEGMTDEVAELVLQDSYWQTWAITLDEVRAPALLPLHTRFMKRLEHQGKLDRALELLPDDEQLAERQAAGEGLTRPEIALLVSYAKMCLYEQLLASDLPDEGCFNATLEHYFPTPLRKRFSREMQGHRLRREIIATYLSNRIVNRLGSTFAFRLHEDTGASSADIARAYTIVWRVYGLGEIWSAIPALDGKVPGQRQAAMMIESGRLVSRVCRLVLRSRGDRLDVAGLSARFAKDTRRLWERLPELLNEPDRESLQRLAAPYIKDGVPEPLALKVAGIEPMLSGLDIIEVAEGLGQDAADVAKVYFELGSRLELHWLKTQASELSIHDHWHARARSAFRDDVYEQQKLLAAEVLAAGGKKASADARLESWLQQHQRAVEHTQKVLVDLKTHADPDLAMLSVALRDIRELTQGHRKTRSRGERPA